MNCYETIDLMGDELEGRLPDELRPGFEAHLGECTACATYFEQLSATVRSLEGLSCARGTSPRRAELIAEFRRKHAGR
jgi:anti-sigma factor RsiW